MSNLGANYPEVAIGGYSRVDGTVEFYLRIDELVERDHIVVDLGAGRGDAHCDRADFVHARLMNFKGRCRKVIGIDVDPVVNDSPSIDEAQVFDGGQLPLEDASVDIIFSDWVLEHVEHPARFVAELERALKPGGWFCAQTPNRWSYIGLATYLVPNRLHTKVLEAAQPGPKAQDVFPTFYRLNSTGRLRTAFGSQHWDLTAYRIFAEPAYFGRSGLLIRLAQIMFRLTPPGFEPVMLVFARKNGL